MREITMRMLHLPFGEENQDDRIEFVTDGRLYERAGSIYLIYDETELSGTPGCTTSLRLKDGSLRMKRSGKDVGYNTEILFEKGKHYLSEYETPYGSLDVDVLTNDVRHTRAEDGSFRIDVDYQISLGGAETQRDTLAIEVNNVSEEKSEEGVPEWERTVGEKENAEERL
ncbi:MAG: DUF1934 domain-containing protein [Anaerovoracaceae bacterium]